MSLRERIFGKPRDLRDPHIFHTVSLIAFFAWVGLGADGLSSSSYGPEEAFKNLVGRDGQPHYYLAVFVAVAMAMTVFIISYAYSRIIEHFPHGGGGYLVASKLLGERAGLVSGSALLVDYVLTITTSVVTGVNAILAFLPGGLMEYHVPLAAVMIVILVIMNLRGVKESVVILTPIFILFLITHAVLITGAVAKNVGHAGQVVGQVHDGLSHDMKAIGLLGIMAIFFRAYSLGGSAYTGIEAVSNGLAIMRAPQVHTGKKTMVYMATSLAICAGGIVLAYLLLGIKPDPSGKPMNWHLSEAFFGTWSLGGVAVGKGIVVVTMVSEGALLFVAAQAGFIDGPRVMANMALDHWMPHQFASLSERLTMRNGVYLMGGAALVTLFYTHGSVDALVTMYSINVFLTFSLSNLGMSRYWIQARKTHPEWRKPLTVHLIGLALCAGILCITVFEKFTEGGWVTLVATSCLVVLCYWIRLHYQMVAEKVRRLNEELAPIADQMPDKTDKEIPDLDPMANTAVLLAGGFGGLGVHTLLQIQKVFPNQFQQVIFVSAGVLDSGTFKGADEKEALEKKVASDLKSYVDFSRKKLGWAADSDMVVGTEAVAELERLCREVKLRHPRSVFFAGKLIFREPTWWHRLLHNETAHAVQRRLEFDGLPMVVLPVRVLK